MPYTSTHKHNTTRPLLLQSNKMANKIDFKGRIIFCATGTMVVLMKSEDSNKVVHITLRAGGYVWAAYDTFCRIFHQVS